MLCTDLVDCSVEVILGHGLERHRIEDFYKGAKVLGSIGLGRAKRRLYTRNSLFGLYSS